MAFVPVLVVPNLVQIGYDSSVPAYEIQAYQGGSWVTVFSVNLSNSQMVVKEDEVSVTNGGSYSTTSTTAVCTGTSAQIANPPFGRIEVTGQVTVNNNTASDGVEITVYRTTGSVPAQGAAPGGSDTKVVDITITPPAANENEVIPFHFFDSGLSNTSTYSYYVCINATTAGTAAVVGGNGNFVIAARLY
jgi:hypothetical protein